MVQRMTYGVLFRGELLRLKNEIYPLHPILYLEPYYGYSVEFEFVLRNKFLIARIQEALHPVMWVCSHHTITLL